MKCLSESCTGFGSNSIFQIFPINCPANKDIIKKVDLYIFEAATSMNESS